MSGKRELRNKKKLPELKSSSQPVQRNNKPNKNDKTLSASQPVNLKSNTHTPVQEKNPVVNHDGEEQAIDISNKSPTPGIDDREGQDPNTNSNNNPNPKPNPINHLNMVHPTIKFTHTISSNDITYLDLDIYIQNNILQTKTHFKNTNTFSYLHSQSNHPPSTFKGVHKGENIRKGTHQMKRHIITL